ncbi:hypothetical protein E1B28_013461 [Marasmius oreades]|uniref:Uncharacterized protein n=1 Tax=Marasmius oreades TaxID=181124 RepID=A0A9P7UN12_9AGAR|nr:uncharacterized protein E1B28_013461 [Marasmius oreades]KAG7087500.1 hypothetical protein E1B28_013461 [Marasmius oreades]
MKAVATTSSLSRSASTFDTDVEALRKKDIPAPNYLRSFAKPFLVGPDVFEFLYWLCTCRYYHRPLQNRFLYLLGSTSSLLMKAGIGRATTLLVADEAPTNSLLTDELWIHHPKARELIVEFANSIL